MLVHLCVSLRPLFSVVLVVALYIFSRKIQLLPTRVMFWGSVVSSLPSIERLLNKLGVTFKFLGAFLGDAQFGVSVSSLGYFVFVLAFLWLAIQLSPSPAGKQDLVAADKRTS